MNTENVAFEQRKLWNLEKLPKTEEKSSVPKIKRFKKKQKHFVAKITQTNFCAFGKKTLLLNKENFNFELETKNLLYV